MKHPSLIYGAVLALLLLLIPVSRKPAVPSMELPLDEYLEGRDLSRYDKLIREAADSIGWDWRLLSAIIFHESRFNNNAVSPKGARGLMQIHSRIYTPEELADPARNLYVGTKYLKELEDRYSHTGPIEAVKFALASYNLGDSRVASLVDRADALGVNVSSWDSVATLLPKGHSTVSYVNKVLDTYSDYARQYPR